MAEAADRAAWNRTAAVLTQIRNVHLDPKTGRPEDPLKFFPWADRAARRAPPPTEGERAMFREAWPGKGKKRDS